jgi:hypothetical protein
MEIGAPVENPEIIVLPESDPIPVKEPLHEPAKTPERDPVGDPD